MGNIPTETALDKVFEDIFYNNVQNVSFDKWLWDFAEAWTLVKNDPKKRRLLLPSAIKIAEEFKLVKLILEEG